MAPVVCPEKQVHIAGVRESRRSGSHVGVALSSSSHTNTATQSSTVLSYVAKGSMNLAGRRLRRRIARLPSRVEHISKSLVSTSSELRHKDSMDIDEDNVESESSTQISRIHSSSSSNSNSNSNSSNNIKTVLQPTTANSNSNNNNNNSNRTSTTTTTAKFCDQMPSADDDDCDGDEEEEEDQESDSGYEFELEPVKQFDTNTGGLLSIALKTIKLVQRNKLLQKRLAELQLETSEFIASVLANPENRHFREKAAVKADALNKVSNVLLRH